MTKNDAKVSHDGLDFFLMAVVIIFNISITSLAMIWLFTVILQPTKDFCFGKTNTELNMFSNLFFSGVIGGSFYCLRGFYQRIADAYSPIGVKDRKYLPDPALILNIKAWFFWYLYRPIQGGILSVVIICLFNLGVIGLNTIAPEKIDSQYLQIGVGFLVGFGTHEVINKIEEIIKVMFAKSSKGKQVPNESRQGKINENVEIKG